MYSLQLTCKLINVDIFKKKKKTIIYALLTNDIIVLWRCHSRSRRRFLNSRIGDVTVNIAITGYGSHL